MGLKQVGGVSLWVEDTGKGPETIVFSHGLLWSSAMYAPQVARLEAKYRCVSFDFRGQGRSPVAASGYDMDTLSEDAAALIEQLGCGPCHFVGLSMGGFVGMRLALRRPELLRSLTLIDTAADREPRFNVLKYGAMLAMSRVVGLGPFVGTVMKIMFGKAFLEDPARRAERDRLRDVLAGLDLVGVRRATQGVIQRDALEGQLGKIRTRTQVLHGVGDKAITEPRARRMANEIPGARMVMVPRAGHTSTLEEPEAIGAAIEAFVSARG